MKVYLAGSTKEIIRAKQVALDLAADAQVEVLHAWTSLPQDGSAREERLIWRTCFRQIREASAVVGLAPHYHNEARLNGAVFEMGYALGRGLPIILYDLYNNQSGTWKFAEGVTLVHTWPELLVELQF